MEKDPVEKIRLSEQVEVSVVIPHFYEGRNENLERLLDGLRGQTFRELEVILVHGVSPQGKAINEGARVAEGKVLMVMDDDSRVGHPEMIENLVRPLRDDPTIAMAGASILSPPDANGFQQRAARQFPRFQMPVVEAVLESDLPCHGCVAFRKEVFIKVGMEREDIPRGLDPDLRVRLRKAGYRVVLAPRTWAYHPLPASLAKFVKLFYRNGRGSAYLQRVRPDLSYDTDESLASGSFVPKHSLIYRMLRYPLRLAQALVTFQWIRFLGYTVYLFGYFMGLLQFILFKDNKDKLRVKS